MSAAATSISRQPQMIPTLANSEGLGPANCRGLCMISCLKINLHRVLLCCRTPRSLETWNKRQTRRSH